MRRDRDDALKLYYSHVQAHPVLTAEAEIELSRRWLDHQDKAAADKLVLSNMRAVIKIASEFANQHVAFSDLVQEGTMGLLRAIDRYDPDRGTRFLSYAAWWIRAYIRDYLLRTRSLVRLGTTQRQRTVYSRLGRARREADREGLTGEKRMERLVELIGVDRKTVESMMGRLGGYDVSLDAPVNGDPDAAPKKNFIPGDSADPEETLQISELDALHKEKLREAIASLPDREQLIIRRRHLSDTKETLQEVGEELGISRERVRQLESRAMRRMRDHLRAGGLKQVA
ncbi:MAG: sigma-70 family RNA polymerase sigma factor [Proteobacteria bacterium]|nr:sigma-70 family RNA polymerase sigma factor [Pseudomonadota bacterium]